MLSQKVSQRPDVLDTQDLLKRCLGKIEFMERVLGLLLDRGGQDIVALDDAVSQNNLESSYHIAHRLKGAFANASAVQLSGLAEEICEASQLKDADTVNAKLSQLKVEWEDLQDLLVDSFTDTPNQRPAFSTANTTSV